ncbi:MAG: pentapeptide repeat-containing protein [Ruthenibacterium sp.]
MERQPEAKVSGCRAVKTNFDEKTQAENRKETQREAEWMRIAPPDLPLRLETDVSLEEVLSMTAARDAPLEGFAFHGADGSAAQLSQLEVRFCTFTACRFTAAELKGASFRCVRFKSCDFSAVRGMEMSFTQCAFDGCKLAGANFSAGAWNDVSLAACSAGDAVWAECLLKNVSFADSLLPRAVFSDLRPRSAFAFERCDLRAAEFCHTPLKGQDLTTCDIDGLCVTDGVLQGARVTALQACELAKLLGVII